KRTPSCTRRSKLGADYEKKLGVLSCRVFVSPLHPLFVVVCLFWRLVSERLALRAVGPLNAAAAAARCSAKQTNERHNERTHQRGNKQVARPDTTKGQLVRQRDLQLTLARPTVPALCRSRPAARLRPFLHVPSSSLVPAS